jgi:hypothetical protein
MGLMPHLTSRQEVKEPRVPGKQMNSGHLAWVRCFHISSYVNLVGTPHLTSRQEVKVPRVPGKHMNSGHLVWVRRFHTGSYVNLVGSPRLASEDSQACAKV